MAISKEAIFQKAEQITASSTEPRLNEGWKAMGDGRFRMISNAARAHETETSTLKEQLRAALIRGDELSHSESRSCEEVKNLRRDVDSLQMRLKEAHAKASSNQENYLVASFLYKAATAQAEERRLKTESLEKSVKGVKADLKDANVSLMQISIARMGAEAVVKECTSLISYLRWEVEALRELTGSRG